MSTDRSLGAGRSPFIFFLLVFALSVPFWLIGFATGIQLLPGLPIAALAAMLPAVAALILIYRMDGRTGMIAFLKRAFAFPRSKAIWLLPVLLLMPCVVLATIVAMPVAGEQAPALRIPLQAVVPMFGAFFVNAMGEEIGWSGYALDPLQVRFGALKAALLLGIVWALWHIVPLIEAHRSAEWIAWWALGTISMRVLMVWIYNNTEKSVLAVALFHTASNLSFFLVPGLVVSYDPRILGLLLAMCAAGVSVAYGGRLQQRRKDNSPSHP